MFSLLSVVERALFDDMWYCLVYSFTGTAWLFYTVNTVQVASKSDLISSHLDKNQTQCLR